MKYIIKQGFTVLLFFIISLAVLPLSVFASTYGSGQYGCGTYDNSTRCINSQSAPAVCTLPAPTGTIWLYSATSNSSSSITLQFTDAGAPYDHYTLEYGTKSNSYQYGADNIGGVGTKSYKVKSLSPNTTYFFRIRAGNGCATGAWSNEISAKTKNLVSFNQLQISNLELQPVTSPTEGQPTTTKPQTQTPENGIGQNDYIVNVKVMDKSQKPVEGVKVTIHSTPQEITTDANGLARFEKVEAGQHQVLIAYNGYQGEQSVNLTGNTKEFNLNFTIELKNVSLSPLVMVIIGVMAFLIVMLAALLLRARSRKR